jgi:PPOX class probable F420-dependent enzyme
MELNDATRAALTSGKLAHLVTLNRGGSPQVSLVYVGLDGDTIVSGHLGEYRKIKNVRRDPRVSLSIETGDGIPGFDNYLVVEGSAEAVEGGAPEWLQKLTHDYSGPEVEFPPPGSPPGFLLRITATRVYGIGPW